MSFRGAAEHSIELSEEALSALDGAESDADVVSILGLTPLDLVEVAKGEILDPSWLGRFEAAFEYTHPLELAIYRILAEVGLWDDDPALGRDLYRAATAYSEQLRAAASELDPSQILNDVAERISAAVGRDRRERAQRRLRVAQRNISEAPMLRAEPAAKDPPGVNKRRT